MKNYHFLELHLVNHKKINFSQTGQLGLSVSEKNDHFLKQVSWGPMICESQKMTTFSRLGYLSISIEMLRTPQNVDA